MSLGGGPTRPPRSSRTLRESSASGLISVIRTLSSSQDNEERQVLFCKSTKWDREKSRLEKEFKRSDQRLDVLIEGQRDALTRAMQDFNKISSRITSSRDRVKQMKQKLQTAQILLQCKRDELRRLWLESVEHTHVLQLLEQIEGLNAVPQKLDNNISLARYLRATKDLMQGVALLEGELNGVDALREVKDNLQQQKEQLHETLMGELQRHLYEEVSRDCLDAFRKSGKMPNPKAEHIPSHRLVASVEDSELLKLEETAGSERRLDSERQIVILIRCLVLLAKIPESVEMIRERCQGHLFHVVSRTTTVVLESGEGPERLLQLLELIFAQFRTIQQRHRLVLSHLAPHVAPEYDEEDNPILVLYTMEDISSKMQHVLTNLLNSYLGATGSRQESHGGFGTSGGDNMDVNLFFVRKRPFGTAVNPTKQRKFTLFKFDNSQLAISKSSYLQEQQQQQQQGSNGTGGVVHEKPAEQVAVLGNNSSSSATGATPGTAGMWEQVVCPPSYKNISHMYKPMLRFVEELEDAEKSPLQIVLTTAVRDFLGVVNDELQVVVEQSAKLLEDFRLVTDTEVLKSFKATRPVLQSCVAIDGILQVTLYIYIYIYMY
ncbi:exocyst complex component 4-like, partial [Tropilaelaps mercedesae]